MASAVPTAATAWSPIFVPLKMRSTCLARLLKLKRSFLSLSWKMSRKNWSANLPATLSINRPEQRGEQIEKITKSFEYNLMALTLIALMVGMFLIYNTMTISVIRRRPEIGTFARSGSHFQSSADFICRREFVLWCSWHCAWNITWSVICRQRLKSNCWNLPTLLLSGSTRTISLNPWTIVLSFAIGVGLTFIAGFAPVLEAANVAPAEAVRRASYEWKSSVRPDIWL